MVTDTIGDFIARLKNAYQRGKDEIEVPSSQILVSLARILEKEGFIEDVNVEDKSKERSYPLLKIELRYIKGKPALSGIKRISKPGVRIYAGYKNIPKVLGGIGIVILTTPKGLLTGEKAVEERVGGELLCKVW